MYEEFYGLSRLPFQLLPDPDFFYRSGKHEKALTCLEFGVFERAGFIVITGEIGTGKTTLLRYLIRSLSRDLPIALLNQTFLSPEDFLRTLCQEFSLPYEAKGKSELIELFGTFLVEQYQQGQYVILIVDEAQNLPLNTLEEIRMLSNLDADNERLLQIILVGQPDLRRQLQSETLRQLLQRVEVSYHLEPLDREEIREYINYRLESAGAKDPDYFDDSAIEIITDCTAGIPRLINMICHRSLVYGFADNRQKITGDLLQSMLEDSKDEGLYPQALIESPIPDDEISEEPTDIKANSEPLISPTHISATLHRLTEISGASMKAVELAANKAANKTGEAHLVLLKEQLAEERELRKTLEDRLGRAEDDLARMRETLSQDRHVASHPKATDTESASSKPRLLSLIGDSRTFFSVMPPPRTILLLVLIIAVVALAGLTLWRPQGAKINDQQPWHDSKSLDTNSPLASTQPANDKQDLTQLEKLALAAPNDAARPSELESKVVKNNTPQTSIKPADIEQRLAEPEKPAPTAANAASRMSEVETVFSDPTEIPISQIRTSPESDKSIRSPGAIKPKKLAGLSPGASHVNKSEIYECVVNLANVRKQPSIRAPILRLIARGTTVEVIGKEGKWMQLKNQGGEPAWIHGALLRRLE